jgi:hypothetical protein
MSPTPLKLAGLAALLVLGAVASSARPGRAASIDNLIRNGDFSEGNVGFTSDLPYTEPAENCLWPGAYTIARVFNKPQLHRLIAIERFEAPIRRTGKEKVLFANAGGVEPVTVWQTEVACEPHTEYRISFCATSLSGHEDNGTPPRQIPTEEWVPNLQIFVNKDFSTEFTSGMGTYHKGTMTWMSGKAKTATIKIVRCKIAHGGGLIGLSNIEMVPIKRGAVPVQDTEAAQK